MLIDIKEIQHHQINEQIKIREKLIGEMVGNLYPDILRGEISRLKTIKADFIQEDEMEI